MGEMFQKNKTIKWQVLVLLAFALTLFSFYPAGAFQLKPELYGGWNYPVPPVNEKMLFYVQRSNNNNAIVYETNLKSDSSIVREDPVHVYWIRYSSDSTTAELTYIQRKYAYGVQSVEIEGKNGQFILNFVSYDKKKFYLVKSREGNTYQALTMIDGKMSVLEKVFIQLNGGTFWFPTIEEIVLHGKDPLTKQKVVEHFKP